ncbi:hypothetical protein QE152_g7929 [Popillia japonica]|uniref:Uncharacterized protein n=1 Tax=Popillia japonica TaxID=7064 RepID=A0AAW1MCV6_POPJA
MSHSRKQQTSSPNHQPEEAILLRPTFWTPSSRKSGGWRKSGPRPVTPKRQRTLLANSANIESIQCTVRSQDGCDPSAVPSIVVSWWCSTCRV